MPLSICVLCGETHWRHKPCPKRPRDLMHGWEQRPTDPEDEQVLAYDAHHGPRIREETAERLRFKHLDDASRAREANRLRKLEALHRLELTISMLNERYRQGNSR